MRTPDTTEIRTAIEVLKILGERINYRAICSVMQQPDTRMGDHFAAQTQARNIEQNTRIQTVTAQLEQWRDELLQQRRQCVTHRL